VEKAVGLTQNMIRKTTLHFDLICGRNLPPVTGSSQRIEQVVVNLLVNACQALPDSTRAIRVTTGYDAVGGCVRVSIEDEGVGVPPDALGRIADPFFTTKRDSGGTGLGLAISDRIVRDHGGRLVVTSAPGSGTTAAFTLPVNETLRPSGES
jgi:polar amino acid transport system substrate-binding protein